ncbi:MAG TPA: hypothetical protein VL334_15515 [Anaerolineae bacterium]|nr:hypothetical protein [Anaerolineae bacterium]
MQRSTLTIILLALAIVLMTACDNEAGAATGQAAPAPSGAVLDLSYENALPARNQLLLGALNLEDSQWPLSATQARALLPLWQGIRGAMNSGASAQAETDALLGQIEAGLLPEQLAAIRGWKLTQVDLQEWARDEGLEVGTGSGTGSGAGTGQPGSGQSLSAEERATRQAERGDQERGGLSQALVDAVIVLLERKGAN